MVKTIHEVFDDNVFDKLVEAKGILTWKEFILTLIPKKEEKMINITESEVLGQSPKKDEKVQ